jgi:hypothetical protein
VTLTTNIPDIPDFLRHGATSAGAVTADRNHGCRLEKRKAEIAP